MICLAEPAFTALLQNLFTSLIEEPLRYQALHLAHSNLLHRFLLHPYHASCIINWVLYPYILIPPWAMHLAAHDALPCAYLCLPTLCSTCDFGCQGSQGLSNLLLHLAFYFDTLYGILLHKAATIGSTGNVVGVVE